MQNPPKDGQGAPESNTNTSTTLVPNGLRKKSRKYKRATAADVGAVYVRPGANSSSHMGRGLSRAQSENSIHTQISGIQRRTLRINASTDSTEDHTENHRGDSKPFKGLQDKSSKKNWHAACLGWEPVQVTGTSNTEAPPLNGFSKKAAKRRAAATAPGAEQVGGCDMVPLRGIAKNREQVMNAAPSFRYRSREDSQPQTASENTQTTLGLIHADESSDLSLIHANESSETTYNNGQQDTIEEEEASNELPILSSHESYPPRPPSPTQPSPPTRGDSCLAVARAVEDDAASLMEAQQVDPEELQRRESRQETKEQNRKACGVVACSIITICTIVLAITLGLKLAKKGERDMGVPSKVIPKVSLESHVLSLLPAYTLDSIAEDATSPQSMAYNWMVADPNVMTYSDERIIQRFALGSLFYSTNGVGWGKNTDWLSYEVHECEWHAQSVPNVLESIHELAGEPIHESTQTLVLNRALNITFPCDDPVVKKQYSHLWLIANNLQGSLPAELYLLTSLRTMIFQLNRLTGPGLSTEIGKLSALEAVAIGMNGLTGTIPTEVGLLSRLDVFMLRNNKMAGIIPSQLGLLSDNLKMLDLPYNQFTGTIPESLASLEAMTFLVLCDNELSGTIPTNLALVSGFKWLDLGGNQLQGTIPSELGSLENLKELWLGTNSLTGTVPEVIGSLVTNGSLALFHIHNNNLTGTLQEDLCSIETISDYNIQLVGCNCTCSFDSPWHPGLQLCSPVPDRCTRRL